MNKERKNQRERGAVVWAGGRIKDALLLFFLALVLILAASSIFREDTEEKSVIALSESEIKVTRLLEEIEGVGEANVIVYEAEDGKKNVVVVCEGANNLLVVMHVREAVAAALGTEQNAVKIYPKKQ